MMPRLILSFAYHRPSGGYVLVGDLQGYDQALLRTDDGWRKHICGTYYMLQAFNSDFASIRRGITIIVECDGITAAANLDFNVSKRLCTDIYAVYPFVTRQLKYFHGGLLSNLLLSFCRPLLPKSVHSKFQTGCVFSGGRLDSFFALPDMETSNQQTIRQMQESAQKRYVMAAAFRL
ncbi:expressed unknown protein [Seminavis robusta]|uniref:CRAL-TRIO domain-containing protein n=1 Tax=Seminavis robusta TaxID=568900 RepID=A0A9N8DZ29_9STRA|nr:expressed unknown protein [Seminavis robusta]|eukprot:Sro390_g132970.1 n/a (177) ;mRNA; f:61223-61753